MQREEGAVPQSRKDPALDQLHTGFSLRLVLRFPHPGGDNGDVVMVGELGIMLLTT